MNKFFEGFMNEVKNKPIGGVVLNYLAQRPHFDKFIFVEGEVDCSFYKNVVDKQVGGNYNFIPCSDKSNLIKISNYLIGSHLIDDKEDHYIVDKDYSGLDFPKPDYPEKISVTKYYSFESYAFVKDNFNLLLEECGIDGEDKENIFKLLVEFANMIKDFEAIISMSTKHEVYDIKLSAKEIQKDGIVLISKNNVQMNAEMKERLEIIINNFSIKKNKIFKQRKKELENYLELRGHTLEHFFNECLKLYNKETSLQDLLMNQTILSKMIIDFELI